MKFAVKRLIALFLRPIRSDAQVNMKRLAEVTKSCQQDVFSKEYYEQMLLDVDQWDNNDLEKCIYCRYYSSLILDKFPELASTGDILPGYPGYVAVGQLASIFTSPGYTGMQLLECIIANDTSSDVCSNSRRISGGTKYRSNGLISSYLPYVCPSCVVAHDEVSGSQEAILKAFIEWFLKLDKPQRREVISILGDEDEAIKLRYSLVNESTKAVEEYRKIRATTEQQEQEQRRRELLGN